MMKPIYTFLCLLLSLGLVSCTNEKSAEQSPVNLSEQFSSATAVDAAATLSTPAIVESTGNAKMDSFVSAVPKDRIVHHPSANATAPERAAVDLCNCTHFYTKMLEITMEIDESDVAFREAYFKVIEKEAPNAAKCMSDVRRSYESDSLNKANPQEFGVAVDKYIKEYCPNLIKVMAAAAARQQQ